MAEVPIAYPFVEVKIAPMKPPVAQRSPSVIAVVGKTPAGEDGGITAANKPVEVVTLDDAVKHFAKRNEDGAVVPTTLYNSLVLAFQQNPKPSKVYGVRVDSENYAAALASLEGIDDVTFVALANESSVGTAPGNDPPTGLSALKDHVQRMSDEGRKRIGVAMVNPATPKTATYAADVIAALKQDPNSLQSGRMIVVAARGASGDVATAAMSAIAGYSPQTSMVLKAIRGIAIPNDQKYSPSEITELSRANILPVINPALIVGDSQHFAEGRLFTADAGMLYIDLQRVLDDVDFKLQAGLIGLVGDARITKAGLTVLHTQISAILDRIVGVGEIDSYQVDIPILNILQVPEASRTPAENLAVTEARDNRLIDAYVTVVYGPAIHRLVVNLTVKS